MPKQDELISQQAQLLYNVHLVKRYTNGSSNNKIFEVTNGYSNYILRVVPYSVSTKNHSRFELEWLEYLAKNTTNIAKPIYSQNNNLYELIHDKTKAYILVLFEKATGASVDPNNPYEFNKTLFFELGVVIVQLHKLSMNYQSSLTTPQFHWDDPYSWRSSIQISDKAVFQSEQALIANLHALPITKESYGMIHFDIHVDNFFISQHQIKLFDFFDCHLNWYAADIASILFFMVQKQVGPLLNKNEKERTNFAQGFLSAFLKGYLTTHTISSYWLYQLDLFMAYQMIDEYRCAQYNLDKEPSHQNIHYLQWFKSRIISNSPYVYINYEQLINALSLI